MICNEVQSGTFVGTAVQIMGFVIVIVDGTEVKWIGVVVVVMIVVILIALVASIGMYGIYGIHV